MPKHRIIIPANSPLPKRAEVEEIVSAGKGVLESYSVQPNGRRAQAVVDTTASSGPDLAAMVARLGAESASILLTEEEFQQHRRSPSD